MWAPKLSIVVAHEFVLHSVVMAPPGAAKYYIPRECKRVV